MEEEGGTKENMEDNDNNNDNFLEVEEPTNGFQGTGLVEMQSPVSGLVETNLDFDLGLDF